jgi:hypothetical protein
MKRAPDRVMKLLAVVLLAAAVLKGWQLLTETGANGDTIFSINKSFDIVAIEMW